MLGIAWLRDSKLEPPEYDARVLATTSTFSVKRFSTYTFGFVYEICRGVRFFSVLRILHNQCFSSQDMCRFVPIWRTVSILNGSFLMLVETPAAYRCYLWLHPLGSCHARLFMFQLFLIYLPLISLNNVYVSNEADLNLFDLLATTSMFSFWSYH
jgi:hypothetical protein